MKGFLRAIKGKKIEDFFSCGGGAGSGPAEPAGKKENAKKDGAKDKAPAADKKAEAKKPEKKGYFLLLLKHLHQLIFWIFYNKLYDYANFNRREKRRTCCRRRYWCWRFVWILIYYIKAIVLVDFIYYSLI